MGGALVAGPSEQERRQVTYDTRCAECGRIFPTHNRPQDDHCLNCRGNAARQRRHNHGRAGPGRQEWRFRHPDGATAFVMSCARLDGSTLGPLKDEDGVIVVKDREDARLLASNGYLPVPAESQ
ncbi:MAG: hypothetical protein ACR2NB_09580 [Solirubrobacteraceae bacterium]